MDRFHWNQRWDPLTLAEETSTTCFSDTVSRRRWQMDTAAFPRSCGESMKTKSRAIYLPIVPFRCCIIAHWGLRYPVCNALKGMIPLYLIFSESNFTQHDPSLLPWLATLRTEAVPLSHRRHGDLFSTKCATVVYG